MDDPLVHERPGEILEMQEQERESRKHLAKIDGDGGAAKVFVWMLVLIVVLSAFGIYLH